MKTLTTLFIFLLTINVASAQIASGTALITGNINFRGATTESDLSPGDLEETNLGLILGAGYFVGENFALGLNVGYEMRESNAFISSFPDPIEQTTKTSLFTVGPFARYYHMFDDRAGLFGELNAAFGFGERTVQEEPNVEISRLEAALRPGLTFFISDKWAVEGKFGYLGYRAETEEFTTPIQDIVTTTSEFIVSFNFTTLNLGVAIYPGRNSE